MKASICIPVFNGGKRLEHLLKALQMQVFDEEYEIVIIDSGSTDYSVNILQSFASSNTNITFEQIENSEYGHGKTRNKLVALAKGEYVVFFVQDAMPGSSTWLQEMVFGMDQNPDVSAAFCRHKAWFTSHPVKMRHIDITFDGYYGEIKSYPSFREHAGVSTFTNRKDIVHWDLVTALSNVCAIYRRDVFEKLQFEDVDFAEDKRFAKSALEADILIGYFDQVDIYHSHDYSLLDTYKRTVDEWVAIARTGTSPITFKAYHIITQSMRGYVKGLHYSLFSNRLTLNRKISSIFTIFIMELMIKSGMYVGLNYQRMPKAFLHWSSYQRQWREEAQ